MMSNAQQTGEMDRGSFAKAQRRGAHVVRDSPRNAEYSEALLQGLTGSGCNATPEFLGHDNDGRQILRYVEGETGYPPYPQHLLTDRTLLSIGTLVRKVHDATCQVSIPEPKEWPANEIARPSEVDCIGHNDLAPWNIVFRGGEGVAIIDWDTAGPSSRVWDLAYLAHHVVPFHSDESLANWGWTDPPDRKHRLNVLLNAYGHNITADSIVETAIVRLSSMGAYIKRQGRRGDIRFLDHYRTGQGEAYLNAASNLIAMATQLTGQGSTTTSTEDPIL